jgi:hypothetical protein
VTLDDSAQPLDDLVVGGIELERSVLAEAGDRAVDDALLDGFERRVAKPQPLHHAGTKIFDDDIGRGEEPSECVTAFGRFQIERDGTFSGVLRQEGRAHAAVIEFGISAELARQVAGARHLDFDDLGSELCQLIAAERPGEHVGQIQHSRACEKISHAYSAQTELNSV